MIESNRQNSEVGIIGIPMGFGASQIGSELGVEAMRQSRIRGRRLFEHIIELGHEVIDHGNVDIVRPETAAAAGTHLKYLNEVVQSTNNIFDSLTAVLQQEQLPVILGGDHSIAIGTFSAVSAYGRNLGQDVGLLWFDAHADINTPETTITGNIHGMPLAVLLGDGPAELTALGGFSPKLNPKYFAHIGARDLDAGERARVLEKGLRHNFFTMSDIDRRGMQVCIDDALEIVAAAPGGFAVTFDIDSIDPTFAPGSGTLVRGGLTYRESHLALETIAAHGGMRSFEIVEVNPMLDHSNITVELACELILSALGKTIL